MLYNNIDTVDHIETGTSYPWESFSSVIDISHWSAWLKHNGQPRPSLFTFPHHRCQRKPLVNDSTMHHARVVVHVWIGNPPWRGKSTRHSRRMRNPPFHVSGKRPKRWFGFLTVVWTTLDTFVNNSCTWENHLTRSSFPRAYLISMVKHVETEKKWSPFPRRPLFKCFFLNENIKFRLIFYWSLYPRVKSTISQHWFR